MLSLLLHEAGLLLTQVCSPHTVMTPTTLTTTEDNGNSITGKNNKALKLDCLRNCISSELIMSSEVIGFMFFNSSQLDLTG